MPKIYSAYNRPKGKPCNPGEKVYTYEYESNGEIVRDEWQIFEEIQSYESDCIVQNLIKRYEQTGDESILNTRQGSYEDITDMPTDLTETYMQAKAAKTLLDSFKPKTEPEPQKEPGKEKTANEPEKTDK